MTREQLRIEVDTALYGHLLEPQDWSEQSARYQRRVPRIDRAIEVVARAVLERAREAARAEAMAFESSSAAAHAIGEAVAKVWAEYAANPKETP